MSEGLGSKGEAALLALVCVEVVRYTRPPKASADVTNLSSFNYYSLPHPIQSILESTASDAGMGNTWESVLHGEDMSCKLSRKAEFPDVRGGSDD